MEDFTRIQMFFKDIPGYEGLYQINQEGYIKSISYHGIGNERILKKKLNKKGYYTVGLCKNGIQKRYKVSRLVAETFIPNPDNKTCVDHINTIRTDDRVENLRWVTHKENMNNVITKEHLSESKKGFKNPNHGKTVYIGGFFGKTHSEYTKNKMRETSLSIKKDHIKGKHRVYDEEGRYHYE